MSKYKDYSQSENVRKKETLKRQELWKKKSFHYNTPSPDKQQLPTLMWSFTSSNL